MHSVDVHCVDVHWVNVHSVDVHYSHVAEAHGLHRVGLLLAGGPSAPEPVRGEHTHHLTHTHTHTHTHTFLYIQMEAYGPKHKMTPIVPYTQAHLSISHSS